MDYLWRDESTPAVFEPQGVVLSSFPSAGLAATVAAHYMVQSLKLPRIGLFEAPEPPPIAVIQNGRVNPPIRVYGRPDFSVVLSEFPPLPGTSSAIAQSICQGALQRKARLIVCFEGVVPHPFEPDDESAPEEEESVWMVMSRPDADLAKAFEQAKARPLEDGVIGGVSGALLVLGLTCPIPVAALLVSAKATEGYPDHRAGAALIETLDRFLPELTIDTGPLRTQAELIERALRAAMKRRPRETESPPALTDSSIYQ